MALNLFAMTWHVVEQETSSDNDHIKQSMHFDKICFGSPSGKLSMSTCTNAQYIVWHLLMLLQVQF